MTSPTLGILSLGQTPRPDFVAALHKAVPQANVIVRGGFDDVPETDLPHYQLSAETQYALMVLAYGKVIEIDMHKLIPQLERAAQYLMDHNVAQILFMCSGAFAPFKGPFENEKAIIRPVSLLQGHADILSTRKRVGIINPIASQMPAASKHWQSLGYTTFSAFASPFDQEAVLAAANTLIPNDIDLIMLDCMSFTEESRVALQAKISVPVLLPIKLVQSFLASIYS